MVSPSRQDENGSRCGDSSCGISDGGGGDISGGGGVDVNGGRSRCGKEGGSCILLLIL